MFVLRFYVSKRLGHLNQSSHSFPFFRTCPLSWKNSKNIFFSMNWMNSLSSFFVWFKKMIDGAPTSTVTCGKSFQRETSTLQKFIIQITLISGMNLCAMLTSLGVVCALFDLLNHRCDLHDLNERITFKSLTCPIFD